MGQRIILKKGEKFGRLTIMGETKSNKYKNVMERCLCECGKETWATHYELRSGKKRSCGCLLSDTAREKQKKFCTKHGLWNKDKRFTHIYMGIRRRCKNPNDLAFPLYGGRGIQIEWNNIKEFYDDMYNSYVEHCNQFGEKNTTIDRIDCNGNYNKENCRRANRKVQQNNRTNNSHITIEGVQYNPTTFAEKYHITYNTAKYRMRMYRNGKMSYETLTHIGNCFSH